MRGQKQAKKALKTFRELQACPKCKQLSEQLIEHQKVHGRNVSAMLKCPTCRAIADEIRECREREHK
jgi:ssDNA-binding Zn-finger/Zn-ribbon topoisomerase 1